MEDKREEEELEDESLWERMPPTVRKLILFSATVLVFAVTIVLLFKIYSLALAPAASWILTILTVALGVYYFYFRD